MEPTANTPYPFRNLDLHGKTTKPFYQNLMPHESYKNPQLIPNFMYVDDDLWGFNSTESYKLYGNFKHTLKISPNVCLKSIYYGSEYPMPSHTSDEIRENGYLDYFRVTCLENGIDCADITHLKISYIDRGIGSFKTFANMLKSLFPKLKSLDFSQNYSYHPLAQQNNNDQDVSQIEYDDFLYMLKLLQLDNFRLCDSQSSFFKFLSINDIFDVMPENSLFVLREQCGYFSDEVIGLTNNTLKKYYEKRESKEVYIYR